MIITASDDDHLYVWETSKPLVEVCVVTGRHFENEHVETSPGVWFHGGDWVDDVEKSQIEFKKLPLHIQELLKNQIFA